MNSTLKILVLAAATAIAPSAFANQICSGKEDVSSMNVTCDGEGNVTFSLGRCDFRSTKTPTVTITSVIDGRGGSTQSVSVESAQHDSFTVRITPLPRYDNPDVCRVENFQWQAE